MTIRLPSPSLSTTFAFWISHIDNLYMSLTTQLRAFHLVADAGSFSLAARTAGLSQPTLSAQVRALEASYAVDLFDRRGRGVRMTPTGQSLFTLTTRLVAAEEEARALLTRGRPLNGRPPRHRAARPHHLLPT